ncbi:hypothetical protein MMC31_002881 [Peltigera leucophlebia]|nr:hypothetical protein [Peltigera leucophlebia]
MEAAKDGNNESVPEENESENNQSSSPEILPDEWEESLPNTSQEQDLSESQLPTVSQLIQDSASSSSFNVTPLPKEKQAKENPSTIQKKDTPKGKKDKDKVQPKAAMKDKRKSENTGQKRVRASGGVLLSGSLDAVVEELREGRLQRAEEVREEKRQRKVDIKEQHMPPVHHATKLLIKKYGNTKKELIPWALKVFLDETKAHMFLSLEGEWQEQWLVSVCEEVREGKN